MDLGLADKAALVTAGSKGLGRAIALHLAQEGASVAICARTEADLEATRVELEKAGASHALAIRADVSTAEGCERAVRETAGAFGGLDVLVTNTGGPKPGRFFEVGDDDWESAFRSTLLNVVRLVRAAAPAMRSRAWGRIVNIASVSAKQPIPGLTLSNAMRPAILGLAKDLADELAPHGITVNTVCPGMHATDRLPHLRGAGDESEQAFLQRLASKIPVGRIGKPEELAALVALLASERAGFITGQAIAADGGASRGLH